MWILKGTFLGLWLFAFGTMAFLYLAIFRGLPSGPVAISIGVYTRYTTQNLWWWVTLASCIAIGLSLVRSWHGNGSVALWVVLTVTGVVPAGLFGLFLVLVAKLKEAAGAGR